MDKADERRRPVQRVEISHCCSRHFRQVGQKEVVEVQSRWVVVVERKQVRKSQEQHREHRLVETACIACSKQRMQHNHLYKISLSSWDIRGGD